MTEEAKPLRADARRNRARVLEAAEAVLARDGGAASVRAVAQQAGVGLGTIYRHFPTREALYEAILVDRLQRLAERSAALREAEDAGAAFFGFFTEIVDNASRMKAMADVLADAGIDVKAGMSEAGSVVRSAVEALLIRAQQAGAVREDLRLPELLALLGAACMAAERNQWEPGLRDRTLGVVFDGCRPHH
ncbi:TetR/AcrR family transcriptional regulator [Kitasatospora sp. NPDC090091]|uniref:TetR/AcrR family transcriptional regulator n=1 Tax=Kitasatospora sp. NPDC090091 TaxID=3364081 RepID=UPI00380DA2EF